MTLAEPEKTALIVEGSMFYPEAARHARNKRLEAFGKRALPLLVVVLTIYGWDRLVKINDIPHYILPSPGLVLVTLKITLMALGVAVPGVAVLGVAVLGGVALAILFTQSKFAEMAFFPYAVILQVTPIVSVAPLIFIYVDKRLVALLICVRVVAFYPILANTTLGLKSADHNLRDLMTIYRASRWQRLRYLQLPSTLPYFLGGLRIAGGLGLIGAD